MYQSRGMAQRVGVHTLHEGIPDPPAPQDQGPIASKKITFQIFKR